MSGRLCFLKQLRLKIGLFLVINETVRKRIGMVQKNLHPAGVVAERKIVDDVQFKQTMLVAGPCDKSSMTRADPCCFFLFDLFFTRFFFSRVRFS